VIRQATDQPFLTPIGRRFTKARARGYEMHGAKDRPMKDPNAHSWSDRTKPHTINQDGQLILHHRCINCGRDFAKEEGDEFWRAAHVGLFKVEILPEDVNEQWIVEGCPGEILASDQTRRKSRASRDASRLNNSRARN
jgi:hypothetical protein